MGICRKILLPFTALTLLGSPISAEEAAQPLLTALSSTTISGYVDVGAHWNPGTGNAIDLSISYATEILWKHQDGRLAMWWMRGTNINYSFEFIPPAPAFPAPRHPIAHKNGRIYFQQGEHILRDSSPIFFPSFPGRELPFADVAKVIGSAEPDIMWASGSQIIVWEMSNGRVARQHSVYNRHYVPMDARVVGISRFDNDASMDLVWHDPRGNLWITLMEGLQIRQIVWMNNGKPVNPNWKPRGTGDFNSDGKTDLLWLNNDGRTAVWFMNGTSKIGSSLLKAGQPVPPGWDIVNAEEHVFWGVR